VCDLKSACTRASARPSLSFANRRQGAELRSGSVGDLWVPRGEFGDGEGGCSAGAGVADETPHCRSVVRSFAAQSASAPGSSPNRDALTPLPPREGLHPVRCWQAGEEGFEIGGPAAVAKSRIAPGNRLPFPPHRACVTANWLSRPTRATAWSVESSTRSLAILLLGRVVHRARPGLRRPTAGTQRRRKRSIRKSPYVIGRHL